MPFNLSFGELVVVLIVAVLVFGGRLPEVARKVGRSITEFKRGMNEELRKVERLSDEAAANKADPTPSAPWKAPATAPEPPEDLPPSPT